MLVLICFTCNTAIMTSRHQLLTSERLDKNVTLAWRFGRQDVVSQYTKYLWIFASLAILTQQYSVVYQRYNCNRVTRTSTSCSKLSQDLSLTAASKSNAKRLEYLLRRSFIARPSNLPSCSCRRVRISSAYLRTSR